MPKTSAAITGYLVADSVAAGETIHVAADSGGRECSARLVRIDGPRDDFDIAPWWGTSRIAGCDEVHHPGARQRTRPGSFGYTEPVESLLGRDGLTMAVWFWPGHLGRDMTLLSQTWDGAGFALGVRPSGQLTFTHWGGDQRADVQATTIVAAGSWHGVVVSVDPVERRVELLWAEQTRTHGARIVEQLSVDIGLSPLPRTKARIGLGATLDPDGDGDRASAGQLFEGKIDRPRIWAGSMTSDLMSAALLEGDVSAEPMIEWLFGPADPQAVDHAVVRNQRSRGSELTLMNRPQVCVTGHRWTGRIIDVRLAPMEYSALRLNADDLADARWETTFTLDVPEALESGIYGVELNCGEERDTIPFYVRPSLEFTASEVLYVVPTMTYLAYGNDRQHTYVDFAGMAEARPSSAYEKWVDAHPELGSSLYDLHPDGSGWSFSAKRRPLGNVRPDYVSWITGYPRHFSADLAIVSWLRDVGVPFDVVTDHDLHQHGASLLGRYKVVVTGSHPEYVSAEMLDALESFLARDGRLMYLGGNGFYWVTGVAEDGSIEVRRGHAGSRSWESRPGEDNLSLTLEPGGLWRHRGRGPNALVGVGFAAQGWTGGVPYDVAADLPDDMHKLVFGDLPPGAKVGGFGSLGGAAGDEVDRFDLTLGSPTTSVVLASSERFTDGFQPAVEDHPALTPTVGGSTNPDVRADMTYVRHKGGGAVFSVGSINWASCLPVAEFDNDVAMISTNVLRAFIDGSL